MEEVLMQVVEALQQGATPEEVAQTLMEQGYSEEDIQNIFMTIQQQAEGQMQQEQPPMMQEGGETNNADLMLQIASMIEQGVDINDILNQLVQQGYDQEQAAGIIEQVMIELDNQQMQQPPMEMKNGGSVPDQDIHVDRDSKFEGGGEVTVTSIDNKGKSIRKDLKLKEGVDKEQVKQIIEKINSLEDEDTSSPKQKQDLLKSLEDKFQDKKTFIEFFRGTNIDKGEDIGALKIGNRISNAKFSIGDKETPNTPLKNKSTTVSVSPDTADNTGQGATEETTSGGTKAEGTPLDLGIDLGSYDKRNIRATGFASALPFIAPMGRPIKQQLPYRTVQPIEVSPEQAIQQAMGAYSPSISAAGNVGGGAGAAVQAYLQSQYADAANKAITDTQMTNVQFQQQADTTNLQSDMATDRVNLGLDKEYAMGTDAVRASQFQNLMKSVGLAAKEKKDVSSLNLLNQLGDFNYNPQTGKLEVDPINIANYINSYSGYGQQAVAQQTEEQKKKVKDKTQTTKS